MKPAIQERALLLVFLGLSIGFGSILLFRDNTQKPQKRTETTTIPTAEKQGDPQFEKVQLLSPASTSPTRVSPTLTPDVPKPQSPTVSLRYKNAEGKEVARSELPTLQIREPKGTGSLHIGTKEQIAWTSTNDQAVTSVSIHITEYTLDCTLGNCSSMGDVIVENLTGTNTYEWRVADISRDFSLPPGRYTISLRGITNFKVESYQEGSLLGTAPYIAIANSNVFTVAQ